MFITVFVRLTLREPLCRKKSGEPGKICLFLRFSILSFFKMPGLAETGYENVTRDFFYETRTGKRDPALKEKLRMK